MAGEELEKLGSCCASELHEIVATSISEKQFFEPWRLSHRVLILRVAMTCAIKTNDVVVINRQMPRPNKSVRLYDGWHELERTNRNNRYSFTPVYENACRSECDSCLFARGRAIGLRYVIGKA